MKAAARAAAEDRDPAIVAVEERTNEVVAAAGAIEIADQASYEEAGRFLTERVKPTLDEIDRTFGPMASAAHAAHKEILAQRRRHEAPLQEAERIVKAGMGRYYQQQQEIARREEAQRLEVARREAEDRAVEEAARLEREGKQDEAEARLEAPTMAVVAAPPPPAVPSAAGTAVRMITKWRITNAAAIDRKFMTPDDKKIGQVVRSMGADAETLVGGIEVYQEPSVAAGRR